MRTKLSFIPVNYQHIDNDMYRFSEPDDKQQGKPEGFDSCDRPSNLIQIGLKSSMFRCVWLSNVMHDVAKQQGSGSMLCQALCIISKAPVNSNSSYSPETLNLGQNRRFFPCEPEIWRMTFNIIEHLFYTTSSFVYHSKPSVNSNWSNSTENWQCFVPCDLEIWQITLKKQ